jgi:SpoVK/Ycf46/Vps4 family AAA+-type ATPase
LPDDDEEEGKEEESSTAVAPVGDDEDVPLSKYDAKARAERIKKHVTKVVKQKKKEVGSGLSGDDGIDIMEEIERYTQFGFLKKKILITMANTMDRNEVSQLREWFLNADTTDSGTITLQELKDALKKVTPDADDSKIEILFRGVDRDQSGHIHYAEFLAALSESHGFVTMDRLTEAFDRIDKE